MERFELAEALVRKAGAALRQARLEADAVSCKTGHQDLVTVWDRRTEQFLRQGILSEFPSDAIVGEEYPTVSTAAPEAGEGPLSRAEEGRPEAVVFLVNADQLSALVTLANFDRAGQDGVRVLFGAGCTQCVLYPLAEQARGGDACFIGLTDPSARKCVSADLRAFAAPYGRFLAMEANAGESFLHTETWEIISKRI